MAEATVARLYEGYSRQLYRYCLKHLRSHEDAEDAVQNTFLRVHAALGRGVVPEFESAWLYKIAHNVCLSRCLGAKRRSSVEAPHDLQQLEERMAAPGREGDELVGLDDALARMPEKLRRAILLREWQGLRYAEIAEALGITCSAAETLIFRARRYLARELESSSGRQLRADPPDLRRGRPQKLAAAPRWRSYAPDSTIAPISSTA
jgi:RNA polymerase sigma factor (sigma-70 family)